MRKKKRFKVPHPDEIKNHRSLRLVKRYLENPNLWLFTRASISRGVLVGVFMCFMPMPFQMVAAVIFGIFLRANLILAVVLCWISNPITMPAMLYGCYRLGDWLMGGSGGHFPQSFSLEHLFNAVIKIWQPLVLGCVTAGAVFAISGYFLSFFAWTWIARKIGTSHE